MQIITGKRRLWILKSLKGDTLRPTSDRLRRPARMAALLPPRPHWLRALPADYQCVRIRYLRTLVPFFSTGTLNWAAKAAVLEYL